MLTLDRSAATFVFTGITELPVPSLNRGFSAPVKLMANLSPADLRLMAARDSDPFNRWQAVQTLATRMLVGNVAKLRRAVSERAVASGGARAGAGKQFVPGTESCLDTVYPHRQFFLIASRQHAVRVAFDQEGKLVAQDQLNPHPRVGGVTLAEELIPFL